MNVALWLLVILWGVEAVFSSIPWFAHAGVQVFPWMRHSGLRVIIGLHAAGTLCPFIAGASLWRGQRLLTCLSLTLVASAWLHWHVWTFTQIAWVLRDAGRILLSVLTLSFVVGYSLYRARHDVAPPPSEPATR